MGYLSDYNARYGKCEYCRHHNVTGSYRCAECYGHAFEDAIDLYTFIRVKVTKDATEQFNESEEGKRLQQMVEQHRMTYNQCRDSYNAARDKYIDAAIKRVEESLDSI